MKKFLVIKKNRLSEVSYETEANSIQEVVEVARKEHDILGVKIYDITNSEKAFIK